jgi:hypothetical protein
MGLFSEQNVFFGNKPMGLFSEQNIFFGNKPMGLCANKFFFSPFKIRLKNHFLSESRSVKILWDKI